MVAAVDELLDLASAEEANAIDDTESIAKVKNFFILISPYVQVLDNFKSFCVIVRSL